MKTTRLLLAASVWLAPAFAGYTYDYANQLNLFSAGNWTFNGTNSGQTGSYTSYASNGGALIFGSSLPAPSGSYEVRYTLRLASTSASGSYLTYLRATSTAQLVSGNTGTFYAVEVYHPTFTNGVCSATLKIDKQIGVNTLTTPYQSTIPCHDGMVVRTVMLAGERDRRLHRQYLGGVLERYYECNIEWATRGGRDSFTDRKLYVYNRHRPPGYDRAKCSQRPTGGDLPFPNRVDIQFPGDVDDANGTGVAYYNLWRDGAYFGFSPTPEFSDTTVAAGTTYTYLVQAADYHYNTAGATVTVTTPPAGAIDPREVGVRPTGTYWGSAGEQIDMRSGNVNFTMPLVKVIGRGGWSAGFNLSYNSQNWRQDPGGIWQLGRDTGYGYGWRLQAGSLTPVYSSYYVVHHYLFIDSTGAEYHLNVNTNGVWTAQESIYISYDTSTGRLYFPDGSFWLFGSLSGGVEEDAGTMYPTLMQDSNGNQTMINYNAGLGLTSSNSSSRINTIEDVRGNGAADYTFTYALVNGALHLTGITNSIQTAESYTFTYSAFLPLHSPFTPPGGYGSWTFLSNVSTAVPLTTAFTYDPSGTGELNQVTFPYGGQIHWAYGSFTYFGSRTLREVNSRVLYTSAGASPWTYALTYGQGANPSFHNNSQIDDAGGVSEKEFVFGTTAGQANFSLLITNQTRLHWANITGAQSDDYAWTTDSAGNPYISLDVTTKDYGNPGQVQKQTTQARDQYGNLTQMQVYDYGNLGTPARTYTNTYLTGSNYTSRYIFNRLLTSTVTDGTNSTTLATNVYDNATNSYCTGTYSLTNVAANEHDNTNYGTGFAYRGNPAAVVTPSGTRCISYDIAGNVVTHNNNGLTTSVTTVNNYAVPGTITTNSLHSTATWEPFLGLSTAAGPNGDTSSVTYDANARPQTSTSTLGAQTTYTYNDGASPHTKVATTNGHWVRTTMDGFGRTIKTETGNGTTTVSTVDTTYISGGCEPLGKMGKVSQPYAPSGTVYNTTYRYDGLSRTLTTVAPDGSSTTSYSYSGNTVTVTDPALKTKTFTRNALGNLTQVQEPDPLGPVITTYTYDILNHLISVSMPRGSNTQTRKFNYLVGTTVGIDLLTATNPENGKVTYTYNSDHTMHTKTDAKGQVFTYAYDSYKRVWQLSVGATTLRTFLYDTNSPDPTFSQNGLGRLVAVQNAQFNAPGSGAVTALQFTEMFGYSQAGQTSGKRLQANETLTGGTVKTLNMDATYAYDIEGKMTSVAYPTTYAWNGTALVPTAGPTYTYSFDAMDRATGFKDQNNNTAVNGVQYNAANQYLAISYFGTNETWTYNSMNQLTRLTIPGSLDVSYNFTTGSNNGQISSQKDNSSGETVTYQYDSLKRLISASGSGWSEAYGYDSFGNLTSKTPTGAAPTLSQAVSATTNQIVGQTYDPNGNQLSGPLGSVTYDAENRILTAPGVQYAYDSTNKRIWRGTISGGSMTAQEVYFYGADRRKLATYALTAGAGTAPYLANSATNMAAFFGKKRVGITTNGTTTAFIQNRLGSQGSYYPYGEDRGTPLPNDQVKFATYTRDSASGLDYANQRYYANNFGRFMTPDPYRGSGSASNPQSWNRYPYAQGDPVNFGDPGGLCLALMEDGNTDSNPDYSEEDSGCGGGGLDVTFSVDVYLSTTGVTATPDPPEPPAPEPPAPPPPAPPPPDAPTLPPVCSIGLFERPVPFTGSPAQHTYLDLNSSDEENVIEAGPSNRHNPVLHPKTPWGTLDGRIDPVIGGKISGNLPGTNPRKNHQVGGQTGSEVCNEILMIGWELQDYQAGVHVQYAPIPNGKTTFNSNSFTYTLLSDIGLGNVFTSYVGYAPGWGQLVPGLH